jgi:hypothetical protein
MTMLSTLSSLHYVMLNEVKHLTAMTMFGIDHHETLLRKPSRTEIIP